LRYNDPVITEKELNHIMAPFKLDLAAYFQLVKEDVIKIINKAKREGKTPEDIMKEIGELF
jgi:hypothetical protein